MFFVIFLRKCNIVNIKIICFLLTHFNSFFNNYLFFKFINKYQKEIPSCAPPSSHVCDFILSWRYNTMILLTIKKISLLGTFFNRIIWFRLIPTRRILIKKTYQQIKRFLVFKGAIKCQGNIFFTWKYVYRQDKNAQGLTWNQL